LKKLSKLCDLFGPVTGAAFSNRDHIPCNVRCMGATAQYTGKEYGVGSSF
jgi:hypothetical protein